MNANAAHAARHYSTNCDTRTPPYCSRRVLCLHPHYYCRKVLRDLWRCPEDALFLADRVFDHMDEDGSGSIDVRELYNGISAALRGDVDTRAAFFFSLFDTEGEGHMQSNEVLRMLLASTGRDDVSEEDAKRVLASIDTDGSGTVEWLEFLAAVKAEPGLLDALSRVFGRQSNVGSASLFSADIGDIEDAEEVAAASTDGNSTESNSPTQSISTGAGGAPPIAPALLRETEAASPSKSDAQVATSVTSRQLASTTSSVSLAVSISQFDPSDSGSAAADAESGSRDGNALVAVSTCASPLRGRRSSIGGAATLLPPQRISVAAIVAVAPTIEITQPNFGNTAVLPRELPVVNQQWVGSVGQIGADARDYRAVPVAAGDYSGTWTDHRSDQWRVESMEERTDYTIARAAYDRDNDDYTHPSCQHGPGTVGHAAVVKSIVVLPTPGPSSVPNASASVSSSASSSLAQARTLMVGVAAVLRARSARHYARSKSRASSAAAPLTTTTAPRRADSSSPRRFNLSPPHILFSELASDAARRASLQDSAAPTTVSHAHVAMTSAGGSGVSVHASRPQTAPLSRRSSTQHDLDAHPTHGHSASVPDTRGTGSSTSTSSQHGRLRPTTARPPPHSGVAGERWYRADPAIEVCICRCTAHAVLVIYM